MIYSEQKAHFNMQKTFYHYQGGKKPITVKIRPDFVTFHFKNQDDEEFYDIPIFQWKDGSDFWPGHMMTKNWFTEDMKKFIDDSTKEKIS